MSKIAFTDQLRAIDDAELDPYQFRLVIHFWRMGRSWESLRTIAEKCNMSLGMVKKTRDELIKTGWIKWEPVKVGATAKMAIVLCSPHEQAQPNSCSPREQRSPREQERSPHEQNPVALVHPMNAILNEPSILNEPNEILNSPLTPLPNEHDELRAAVCAATRVTEWLLSESDKGMILGLFKSGYTAHQVGKLYGTNGWWYLDHWKGKKGQRPKLRDIVETIGEAVETLPVSKNGHKRTVKIKLDDGTIEERTF